MAWFAFLVCRGVAPLFSIQRMDRVGSPTSSSSPPSVAPPCVRGRIPSSSRFKPRTSIAGCRTPSPRPHRSRSPLGRKRTADRGTHGLRAYKPAPRLASNALEEGRSGSRLVPVPPTRPEASTGREETYAGQLPASPYTLWGWEHYLYMMGFVPRLASGKTTSFSMQTALGHISKGWDAADDLVSPVSSSPPEAHR